MNSFDVNGYRYIVGSKITKAEWRPHEVVTITAIGERRFLGTCMGTEVSYNVESTPPWIRYVEPAPKATVTLELEHREPAVGETFYADTYTPAHDPLAASSSRPRMSGEYLSADGIAVAKRWVVVGKRSVSPANVRW